MKKMQLKKDELIVGAPLVWPVYGQDGELLLEKGQSLSSEKQKHILITRGLYREPTTTELKRMEGNDRFTLSSPFNILDAIRQNITRILDDMSKGIEGDYSQRVIRVATVVQKLCRENVDAALGAIILDQNAMYTEIHPVLSAILTELLLKRKKIPAEDRLLYIAAALTQNIGMLALQEVLHKQAAPLTEKQREQITQHPTVGKEILEGLGVNQPEWLSTVLNHHERPDGKGYPNGLKDEQIDLFARTLSLADIYSAMILPREYRDGIHVKKALREIFVQRGSIVDESLAQFLIKEMGIYPPGTFVQLANGDTAIVIRRGLKEANAPLVLSILSPRGAPYKNPQQKDTKYKDLYGIIKVLPRIEHLELDRNEIWGLGKR